MNGPTIGGQALIDRLESDHGSMHHDLVGLFGCSNAKPKAATAARCSSRSFPTTKASSESGTAPGSRPSKVKGSKRGNLSSASRFVCMSQAVQPPILPKGSPDRDVNCEVALEAAFAALVTASEAKGWTPRETAAALLKIATEHAQRFRLVPAEPPGWRTRRGMFIACATLVSLLCAAIVWWGA
ncbi:MAG: hypothetical protein E5Y86_21060 [Mesorhizobium sp.]|nr:MAG: hypothetical protein E5Y86_21060 [Mesorhizobium sp.]